MTVNYTTLLGLAKPVTGTEQGDWGDVVNDEITTLLEDAVANSVSISVTAGDPPALTDTNGATNQARMSTLIITGSPGVTRNIVAPSRAKIYQVINQSNGAVVIKGTSTTGVTIAAGATGTVAWNGSDFIEIGSTSSGRTFNGNVTVNGVITAQAAATQDAVKLQGRAGGSSSYAVTITPTTLTANRTITAPDTALTLAGIDVAQTFTAVQTFTPAARTSGAVPYFTLTTPADTGQTSSTESIGASFTAATRTWATGSLTLQRERVFGAPTYAFAGASTLTTAINVDIGTPTAGSNATITNAWALRSGPSLFVGNVRAEAAATQDAVVVAGRAGGTSSYAVTITPTTLAANRTFTLPDATTVAAGLAVSQTFTGIQTFMPDARTSGASPYFVVTMPTDTGQTAGTESIGVSYTAGTRTWAGGTLTLQRERVFAAPTYAFGGVSTLTTAINVDIATPAAGANATITNAYALRAGASLFTGTLTMDSTNAIDTTNLEVTNIKAKDGTAAMSIADSTGVVTVTKDEVVNGVTVGRGAGAVATNTAVGASALAANSTGARLTAVGANAGPANTASDNTFVGYNTGQVNTSGINNTALGSQALATNISGGNNTAIGYTALLLNTGSNNTAVGGGPFPYATLSNNSSGEANTAIGTSALAQNTIASNNTAVGYQAGYSNTTGTGLAALGYQAGYTNNGNGNTAIGGGNIFIGAALYANSSGNNNVGIGSGALTANTVSNNTAVGYAAATANTTGTFNVAVGTDSLRSNTYASNNTAVGYQAAYSNISGSRITALGYQSFYSNTTSSDNTAIGWFTLYSNSAGTFNTAVGGGDGATGSTLSNNTTGSNNTGLGFQALRSNTTASNNTAVGYQAGYSNTTGAEITALGYQAGYGNTTGNYNTFVGAYAGKANTTGTQNAAFGYQSMSLATGSYNTAMGLNSLQNASGSYNTAIGNSALNANTTASYNTAVGYQALYSNVTGVENAAFGFRALDVNIGSYNNAFGSETLGANTSGANNTAFGHAALGSNTTASNNTAVGYQAGYSNVDTGVNVYFGFYAGRLATAKGITAIGAYALANNTTGAANTAVGTGYDGISNAALQVNTTGSFNVALGTSALANNTTASNNTAVGYQAGYSNTTGTLNTFIGTASGYTNAFGNNNTYIGRNAGYVATGNSNTFVGMSSGDAVTTGANNTILGRYTGNNSGLDIRTLSNYIVLSDGDGYPAFWGLGGASGYMKLEAGRLEFPATQNASANANTLDDYEEGTWTATLTDGTNTTTSDGATYRKIGSLVFLSFQFYDKDISAWNAANLSVTGLPFTVATNHDSFVTVGTPNGFTVSGPLAMGFSNGSTSSGLYYRGGGANWTGVQKGDITNNSDFSLYLSACYTAS